jgi:hypothetical protein
MRRLYQERENTEEAHNLLKRCAEHSDASANEALGVDLDIGDRANPHTCCDDNHCRYDLGGVVFAVDHPFHQADDRNHAQLGNLQIRA